MDMFGKQLTEKQVEAVFEKVFEPKFQHRVDLARKCIHCGQEALWVRKTNSSQLHYLCHHCWRNFLWEKNQTELESFKEQSSV